MRHTFFGGAFPTVHKESTRRKSLTKLDHPPKQVAIPLVMSENRPARSLVHPGDKVTVGQPIAIHETSGIQIHSSVSGHVAAVEDRPHPWGGYSPAIAIQNDGQDTPFQSKLAPLTSEQIDLETLLGRVAECGILGMGGGAYPTCEKLKKAAGQVDTLIVNAAECEPYITADYRLLMEQTDAILTSTQVLARCLGVERAVLVTEGDKIRAAEQMERRLRKRSSTVELCTVRTRYPLGAEKQIVQTVTGREVPPGKHPLSAKCVVLNVATVYAIHQALFDGCPLTHRAVTVSGGGIVRPRNLWVPIGTPLRHLLEECGGLKEEHVLLLTGGPMMGSPVPNLDAPVVKNTNSLLALADWERKADLPESVCIRCGKCVESCPMHLAPTFIRKALKREEYSRFEVLHVDDCIACGCCSFICPSNIPLVDYVAQAKDILKIQKGGDA